MGKMQHRTSAHLSLHLFPDRFFAIKARIHLAHHSILGCFFPVRGPLRLNLIRYDLSTLFISTTTTTTLFIIYLHLIRLNYNDIHNNY